ncbi:18163_t:CDS:2 [Gigaspora margarita]|uniref:18163_t:CDS:1 n=1 Tax=Gigaspora margarita TaxID=4874 RepID=A0ABM8VWL2_GIGMA|nr:18163_t:CDS:2 [Gigaspora margarita]
MLWNIIPYWSQPAISEHTVPQSTWTIPINKNSIDNDNDIEDEVSLNQHEDENEINNNVEFPLHRGWALKGNQKLGNRGGAKIKKNIRSLLEGFFLNGNRRNQDRMDGQAMCNELLKYAESGDIEEEDVLGLSTIQNWLHSYAHMFKQKAIDNELELK